MVGLSLPTAEIVSFLSPHLLHHGSNGPVSSGHTPTASPTHPSGHPSLLSNPNPIPFSAPTSGIGNHQHSSTMYQALFPSISADGCQY